MMAADRPLKSSELVSAVNRVSALLGQDTKRNRIKRFRTDGTRQVRWAWITDG